MEIEWRKAILSFGSFYWDIVCVLRFTSLNMSQMNFKSLHSKIPHFINLKLVPHFLKL